MMLQMMRRAALLVLAGLLVSCGGGGGGGLSSDFYVTFNTSTVNISYVEGDSPPAPAVVATAHGTPPDSGIFIGAIVSGTGLAQPIPIMLDTVDGKAYATFAPMYGLHAGTYSGTVQLLACADEMCKRNFTGSPHTVSYTITVLRRLAATPSSLSFTVAEKQVLGGQTLTLTLPEGTTTVQTAVNYSPGPMGWLQVENNGGTLVVTPHVSALAAGNYSAQLLLTSADGKQQRMVPVSLSVTYDPLQHLRVDKSALSLASPEGRVLSAEVIQASLPPGSSAVMASVSYGGGGSGWLQVQVSGTSLSLVASAVGLTPGSYQADLTVKDVTTNESVVVPVSLTVSYDALMHLRVDQPSIAFAGVETQVLASKSLQVGLPPGASGFTSSVAYGAGATGWLQAQNSGSTLVLSASTAGLAPGNYAASLTVRATGTAESLVVPVSITINQGLVALTDETVTIDMDAMGTGSFWVPAVSGVSATQWSAASDQPWLVLDAASGAIGGALHWHLDHALFNALANNADYVATITVAGNGLSGVSKQITFQKRLKEITRIDSLALLAGESGEVMLYGEGFAGLSNFAAHLQLGGGLVPVSITVLGDRVASVTLQNVAAGDYMVALSSAMGAVTHSNTLRVMEHQDYPYQVIPTDGKKRTMVWDPVSRSAFVPDAELARIHRFQWNGSTFVHTTLSTGAPLALGMARDQHSLVLALASGDIQFYDPVTLALQTTGSLGGAPGSTSGQMPLAITGDDRLWIARERIPGSPSWSDLLSISLLTGFSDLIGGDQYTFYDGPWGVVSPNGRRMIMSQTAALSPSPVPLKFDLATNQVESYPSGTQYDFFIYAAGNRDGTRWILDQTSIYNFSLDRMGGIARPAGWSFLPGGWMISDDGTRGYFYAVADGAISDSGEFESTTPDKPRIYVYDLSNLPVSQVNYTLLGYFEIPDYSACRAYFPYPCDYTPRVALARDGSTIFVAGDRNFVVAPVPPAYQQGATAGAGPLGVMMQFSGARKPPAEMRHWFP